LCDLFLTVCITTLHFAPYSRMEDNLPIILFMEWSKNARPVPKEESEVIEIVTAPDEDTLRLREEVEIMKLGHQSLQDRKEQLNRKLNDVTDALTNSRSTCESLENICEQIQARIVHSTESLKNEHRVCEELSSRIQRDKNKAIIGELAEGLEKQVTDPQLAEFFKRQMAESGDPDNLLSMFHSFYDNHHKRLKQSMKTIGHLKTVAHSIKKDIAETEQRIVASERAKKIQTKPVQQKKPAQVVDRKVFTTRPSLGLSNPLDYATDELSSSRAKSTRFTNFFN
jgi:hypothetical protein